MDNPSHWLIFFKMVKTTNQSLFYHSPWAASPSTNGHIEWHFRPNLWHFRRCERGWVGDTILLKLNLGVSENVVYPFLPNGVNDHYPVFKWLFHWKYTLFSDKPICFEGYLFGHAMFFSGFIMKKKQQELISDATSWDIFTIGGCWQVGTFSRRGRRSTALEDVVIHWRCGSKSWQVLHYIYIYTYIYITIYYICSL